MDTYKRLNTAINPLYWPAAVLGVFPFRINHRTDHPVFASLPLVIYSVLLGCTVCTLWIRLPSDLFVYFDGSFDNGVEDAITYVDTIVLGVMLVGNTVRVNTLAKAFSTLYQSCRFIPQASFYRNISTFLLVQVILFNVLFFALQFSDGFEEFEENTGFVVVHIVILVFKYYISLYITFMGLVFSNSLFLLRALFALVNSNLEKMFQVRVKSLEQILLESRKQHELYSGIADKLEEGFGLPMAALTLSIQMSLLQNLYYFLTMDRDGLDCALGLLYDIIQLCLVLLASQMVTQEAARTGLIVHHIMILSHDKQFRLQLKEFSLQLLHNKVKFTAFGLYPLDCSLIYTMGAVIVTFLVVLIQFQKEAYSGTTSPPEGFTTDSYEDYND